MVKVSRWHFLYKVFTVRWVQRHLRVVNPCKITQQCRGCNSTARVRSRLENGISVTDTRLWLCWGCTAVCGSSNQSIYYTLRIFWILFDTFILHLVVLSYLRRLALLKPSMKLNIRFNFLRYYCWNSIVNRLTILIRS